MKSSTKLTDSEQTSELLKKLLILELFKVGVTQTEIGKKLKMKKATVNAFLKGAKKDKLAAQ
jgi:hypothetical protein